MAKIYYRRIVAGEMMLDDVPERWREAVRELLEPTPEEEPPADEEP